MKLQNPEEVKKLHAEIKEYQKRAHESIRKEKYEFYLETLRQYLNGGATSYMLREIKWGESLAYSSVDIRFTQDPSWVQTFSADEAVTIQKQLPFEARVAWRIKAGT